MSEQSRKSFFDSLVETLCCCLWRRPKVKTSDAHQKVYSDREEPAKRENMRNGIPFQHHFSFEPISQLPAPEPGFPKSRGFYKLWGDNDPKYQSIISAPISLPEKLRKALELRDERIASITDGTHSYSQFGPIRAHNQLAPIQSASVAQGSGRRLPKRRAPLPPIMRPDLRIAQNSVSAPTFRAQGSDQRIPRRSAPPPPIETRRSDARIPKKKAPPPPPPIDAPESDPMITRRIAPPPSIRIPGRNRGIPKRKAPPPPPPPPMDAPGSDIRIPRRSAPPPLIRIPGRSRGIPKRKAPPPPPPMDDPGSDIRVPRRSAPPPLIRIPGRSRGIPKRKAPPPPPPIDVPGQDKRIPRRSAPPPPTESQDFNPIIRERSPRIGSNEYNLNNLKKLLGNLKQRKQKK